MSKTKTMMMTISCALAVAAASLPIAAHASEGAVKVDCKNNCDNVTLGQICDTFSLGSEPIGLSCENTANPGRGTLRSCGAGGTTCRVFGSLIRGDLLGSYCYGNGPGNNSLVICDTTPEAFNAADELEGKELDQ